MPRRRLARALAALSVAVLASSCGLTHLQDLNFRIDKRLTFLTPKARSTVHTPLTVSWTMRDFTIAAQGSQPPSRDAGYFAVFVDHTPIQPGHTMKDVAAGDRYCQQTPGCPNAAYLKQHQVFITTATTLRLPFIAQLSNVHETNQPHSITIVLMDTSGHRIGESAWELDVRIPKVGV